MKKLFFYAAAALAMLASCQKAEISGSKSDIDDSQPVAIQFGIDAPSLTVTKTKAAVDSWSDNTVYVYGFKQQRDSVDKVIEIGAGCYDFTDILINNYSTVAGEGTLSTLDVYDDTYPGKKIPYYYAEGQTYDFYGYHLGYAPAPTPNIDATNAKDVVSLDIEFDGSQDVMYATTNRQADIDKKSTSSEVTTSDLYSSWAARRGVQPTLKFQHALTRFNFIVKGKGDKYQNVRIDSISMQSVNKGVLTVVGKNLGFVADTSANPTALKLKNADDSDYTPEIVLENSNNVPAGNGSSLMVAPGMEKVAIKVGMTNIEHTVDVEIPAYEFELEAKDVKNGPATTTFAAGSQYNVYINVYGPEAISIEAELTAWQEGGEFTYDPDDENRPGTPVAAVLTVEKNLVSATSVEYNISYDPTKLAEVQYAITDSMDAPAADDPSWTTSVITRSVAVLRAVATGLVEGKTYYCHVRYKELDGEGNPATEYKTVKASAVPAEPEFNINGFMCVDDEAAFNTLPESYLATHKYDPASTDLPWLAVWFTKLPAGESVKVKLTKDGVPVSLAGCASWGEWADTLNVLTITPDKPFSLFTFNQPELSNALESGEWEITLTYGDQVKSQKIVVALESEFAIDSFDCIKTAEDFNTKLPAHYRADHAYDPNSTDLPWLAVSFTKCPANETVKVVLKKDGEIVNLSGCNGWAKWSDKTQSLSVSAGKAISLFTFNQAELGGKLATGKWTVELTYGSKTVSAELDVVIPVVE